MSEEGPEHATEGLDLHDFPAAAVPISPGAGRPTSSFRREFSTRGILVNLRLD